MDETFRLVERVVADYDTVPFACLGEEADSYDIASPVLRDGGTNGFVVFSSSYPSGVRFPADATAGEYRKHFAGTKLVIVEPAYGEYACVKMEYDVQDVHLNPIATITGYDGPAQAESELREFALLIAKGYISTSPVYPTAYDIYFADLPEGWGFAYAAPARLPDGTELDTLPLDARFAHGSAVPS